jgi:hypothetical protein
MECEAVAPKPIPSPWDTIDSTIEVATVTPLTPPRIAESATRIETSTAGGGFTIPLICLGIGVIAMCLLVPAADENRRLAYERDRLKTDLEQLEQQVATNDAFLHRVSSDPSVAERLARRQMKMVPVGTTVLELKSAKSNADMSPYTLVAVPPPAPMQPYKPVGGLLANAVRHSKTQLYLIGAGMMMIACGLVMSRSSSGDELEDEFGHDDTV